MGGRLPVSDNDNLFIPGIFFSQQFSGEFQTVLETQRTRLSSQDSVAVARAAVSADHVRLVKALGGGWLPPDDTANLLATPDSNRTPAP